MIHYYFGTKEELYQAVLKRHSEIFLKTLEQIDLSDLSPVEALKKFVKLAVVYERTQPYHGKILLHEAMTNEGKYFKLTGWEVPIGMGAEVLQRGVDEGYFRPLDPWLTIVHIMGVMTFYFNATNNLKQLPPLRDCQSPEAIEAFAESAMAFVLEGVLKRDDAES